MKKIKYDLYPVVSGCSTECIFTGTLYQCKIFAKRRKAVDKSFDWILLPAGY